MADTYMDLTKAEVFDAWQNAQTDLDGAQPSFFTAVYETFLSGTIIGAAKKLLIKAGLKGTVAEAGLISAAFSLSDLATTASMTSYRDYYKNLWYAMNNNSYEKARISGNFSQRYFVASDGKTYYYTWISGQLYTTGFYKNGIWMFAE